MKIGIVTYHRSHNYGAVLQAYALKTYLLSLGHIVEIIDYWPEYRKGMYDIIDFSFFKQPIPFFSKTKIAVREFVFYFPKKNRHQKFQRFIVENLGVDDTSSIITKGDKIESIYEVYIFGSDQIWRNNKFKTFSGFDPVYWGKYPLGDSYKKITYAASMGELNYKGQEAFIKEHLNYLNSIAVRESNLKEVLEQFTKKPVSQVLDPVFLLNRNDWESLIPQRKSKGKSMGEKYLLFYQLNHSAVAKEFVNSLANSKNLRIIEIKGEVKLVTNPKKTKQYAGPLDFLELFKNASYIVSTSFHGVAFSIIFQKQFYALGMGNNSARVTSLLETLAIKDRYLTDENIVATQFEKLSERTINYSDLNKNLEVQKALSANYLKKAITE